MPHAMRWLWPTMMPGVARQRNARNVDPRRLEMSHVPDAGQRIFEMRIVREQRLARSRVRARDGPGVRPRLHIAARADGKQKVDLIGVAARQHVALDQIGPPSGGQIAKHVQTDQQRIHHAPRPRLVLQAA